MAIITKRGDEGETDLMFGKRASKVSARIEALGAVDEVNAQLGVVRVHAEDESLIQWINEVQENLINLMGELATETADLPAYKEKGYGLLKEEEVEKLEQMAREHEQSGNTFRGWVRPGQDNSLLTAHLHVCRTVIRRAERRCWAVGLERRISCLYLNRLGDVLWLVANPR